MSETLRALFVFFIRSGGGGGGKGPAFKDPSLRSAIAQYS